MKDIGFSLEDYCCWLEGIVLYASFREGGLLATLQERKAAGEEIYQLDDYVLRRGIQELIRIVEPQLDRNWKGLPGVERLLRTDLPYCSSDGIVIPPVEQKDPRHDTSQIAGKSRTRGLFSDNV